ncbi:MAG: HPr-rel-A system PqqD family peptide chaperone [Methylococcaceae bacterium]
MVGLPKDGLVCCRFWGDEGVIYNQLTGETHLVDGIGAEIFKLVSEKTATGKQVLQNLNSLFDFQIDFDAEGFMDDLIKEYQKLGLLLVTDNNLA